MDPSKRPDAQLAESLMQAARTLRRRWAVVLEPWDLSPHQARALRVVCDGARPRLSEVAERLRIAPRSATEVVDGLEERGLIAREPDYGDRRAVRVVATDAGRRLRQQIDAARAADAEELFGRLSAADRRQLAQILAKLGE